LYRTAAAQLSVEAVNNPTTEEKTMPNGAFALYVDPLAKDAATDRLVPLPRLGLGNDPLEFDQRRLTLLYDNLPATSPNSVTVTGRFLGVALGTINVTINAGGYVELDVPRDACAAALHVDAPAANTVIGPLSALVEHKDF
jgi:hypothetical protein